MNNCSFTGRLVRNPESRDTTTGTTLTRYTIGVRRDRHVEGQPDADFINVVTFGKAAEWASNWLVKGTKVEVTGRLQIDQYEDYEGNRRTSVQLIANSQGFAESKKASQENAQPQQEAAPKPEPKPQRRQPRATQEQLPSDEDLPF